MKILLLAGEESGMLYANRLRELLKDHEIRGYDSYGFQIADLAVMGFFAVIKRLPYFLRVKKTMQKAILEWHPDVVVTIDYPGMNLPLARFAKKNAIKTVHVVCPQVWAWKAGRIPKIEASVDKLCCFFPFEPKLFKSGFATFVGHPLVELVEETASKRSLEGKRPSQKNVVALLPGSRMGEVEKNFPTMLEAFRCLKDVKAIVPAANEKTYKRLQELLGNDDNVLLQMGGARELLLSADVAVVASGTATLEAALARCPTILVYRVSPFLAWFARRVIKGIRHIGLINIVWEKTGENDYEPMIELLQENFTADNVSSILSKWLSDSNERAEAIRRLNVTVEKLKLETSAFKKITDEIITII